MNWKNIKGIKKVVCGQCDRFRQYDSNGNPIWFTLEEYKKKYQPPPLIVSFMESVESVDYEPSTGEKITCPYCEKKRVRDYASYENVVSL